jgi:hypothetical protein
MACNREEIGMSPAMLLVLSFGLAAGAPAAEKTGPDEAVFEMREISAFDKSDINHNRWLTSGQYAECSTEPDKEVRAYPKLKSKHPLYGKVGFDRFLSNRKGIEFHFVLDESGESPAPEEKKTEEKPPKKSFVDSIVDSLRGAGEKGKTAPKPSEAKLSPYDRLYFDSNGDLDLTNDPVLKPMKDPPWKAICPWTVPERMAFAYLDVTFDYGPPKGRRPFRLLPWLATDEYQGRTYNALRFVAAVAREGPIRLGKHEYDAILAQARGISGRFDRPGTGLYLIAKDPKDEPQSWGFASNVLMSMQRVDDELYSFSASPLGDRLTVRPYRGDFGRFEIGPGGRKIKDLSFQGSFHTEKVAVGVGPDRSKAAPKQEKIRSCKLPVGDYVPSYLSLEYGTLHISLSDNYHSDGRPRDMERRRTYGIKIRKDKPFVLDFSHKPEVLFASPSKSQTFKPGDEVSIKAVLIDPTLNIMIRGLSDLKRMKKESYKSSDGKPQYYERPLSLDPIVTIRDAAGKKVAEGPMPFG